MKKSLILSLIICCLCAIYSPLFANDSYKNNSKFSFVLKNGEVIPAQRTNNNQKMKFFIGDENGNSLIKKISFNNGSEVLVEPDKDGKFRIKINELDIEILNHLDPGQNIDLDTDQNFKTLNPLDSGQN